MFPLLLIGGIVALVVISRRQPQAAPAPAPVPLPPGPIPPVTYPGVVGQGDINDITDPNVRADTIRALSMETNPTALRTRALVLRQMGYPFAAGRLEARALQLDLTSVPLPIPPPSPTSPPATLPVIPAGSRNPFR